MSVSVRLQALDGTWETCGADRAIGVVPESVVYTHDEWGPKTASFQLRRSVIALWPDLGAFTPVEIEVDGVMEWDGRIGETPTQDVWNVQAEGWQFHLDDDVYQRTYVHSKLTDWKDTRGFLEANLTVFKQSASVQAQQGRITLGFQKGAELVGEAAASVTLDLGPATPGAVAVGLDLTAIGTMAGYSLYVIGHAGFVNEAATYTQRTDAVSGAAVATGTYTGVFAAGCRYITIVLFHNGTATVAEDTTIALSGIRVFSDSAYKEGATFTSALLASTIIKDAIERGTLLLNTDLSQIDPTAFHIPDFALSKYSTPREIIEAANAYHNWITKLGANRRFQFEARPTAPVLELGAWAGSLPEDASANSGQEIYNRAIVEATGPDGSPLAVERTAAQQPGVLSLALASPSPENPSFAASTVGWSVTGGVLLRDTTTYHTAPASGRWAANTGTTLTGVLNGVFLRDVEYRITIWVRKVAAGSNFEISFGAGADNASTRVPHEAMGTFQLLTLAWTPSATSANASVIIRCTEPAGTNEIYIDDAAVMAAEPTIPDRRGFRRTKVIQSSSAITEVEGKQLCDIFLQSHMATPFKGSTPATAGSVRQVIGGQPVPPSKLGAYTQQLIRLSDRVDPDTGGNGRDATIAEVAYEHKAKQAKVTLDDKRADFEALLNRLAVVQSPGS